MKIDLHNRTVVVTGGASGIGLACALLFREAGADVHICDINSELISELRGKYELDGFHQLDVTDEQAIEELFRAIHAGTGKIDILVNNAGIMEPIQRTVDQDSQVWSEVINVNLKSAFLMTRECVRYMRRARSGVILNIASITGLVGFPASNSYGVSKAGLIQLTKSLSAELASSGIRVNCIAPGFVETPMTNTMFSSNRISEEKILQRIPANRLGKPDEIAAAAVFLCSDWASYITGVVLPVDGGWTGFGGP